MYQSATRGKKKELSDRKELKNTLHLLHPSSRTDTRGPGGNHMQNHKAQGAEAIPNKIQGKHCKMRFIFHASSKHSKQTLYVLRTVGMV